MNMRIGRRLKSLLAKRNIQFLQTLIVGFCFLLFVIFRPNNSESIIRFIGLTFQLVGIGYVFKEVSATLESFGRPSIDAIIIKQLTLLAERLKPNPPPTENFIAATFGMVAQPATSSIDIRLSHPSSPDLSAQEHINILEMNLGLISDEVSQINSKIDIKIKEYVEEIKSELENIEREQKGISQSLKEGLTGSIHFPVIGAIFVGLGTILTTISKEISCLFSFCP
jgi:hypothetical protein